MTVEELHKEIEKWQQAVTDQRTTMQWLEERGDAKSKRIRELEAKVKELGGTP